MPQPEVKAQAFLSRIESLRALLPADELAALLAAIPQEIAELVRHPPLAMSWVPALHWAALIESTHRLAFHGDDARVLAWGRDAMTRDLNTVFRVLLRMATPVFMAKRASSMFDQSNRNNGRMRAEPVGDRGVDVHYEGLVTANPSFWVFQTGLIDAAATATGARGVATSVVSGGGASQPCTLRVTWS